MLEKIGLPAKPAAKGSSWVVDASSCQSCQGAFSIFNRKHHCRRCGGIFCGNCSKQTAILRGQGDAPVRICGPCKKLEEAARFQLRNRGKKGAIKANTGDDDLLLREVLGDDMHALTSAGNGLVDGELDGHPSSIALGKSGHSKQHGDANFFPIKEEAEQDTALTPQILREQAVEQKILYTSLKKEGKNTEALQAYKRSKELGREADALELSLRKIRKASTVAGSKKVEYGDSSKEMEDGNAEEKRTDTSLDLKKAKKPIKSDGDEDLMKALKDLGWNEAELVDKKSKKVPTSDLELLAEVSDAIPKSTISKKPARESPTQLEILAHKRKALALKREGNPAQAKEELKKAKILERKLEEMQLLDEDEEEEDENDDELAVLMRSLDKEAKKDLETVDLRNSKFDFSMSMLGSDDDDDTHVDVTDDDVNDPSMVAALRAMGWEEEASAMERSHAPQTSGSQVLHIATSATTESGLQSQILTQKRKALALKREGKIAEAKVELQEVKVLEQKLEVFKRQTPIPNVKAIEYMKSSHPMRLEEILDDKEDVVEVDDEDMRDPDMIAALKAMGFEEEETTLPLQSLVKFSPQEERKLQEEILSVKKSALALKKQGRTAEAKDELRQAKVLEQKLQKMQADLEADAMPPPVNPIANKKRGKESQLPVVSAGGMSLPLAGFVSEDEEEEVEVSADDFMDPELIAALKSVGWQEEDTFIKDREAEKEKEPSSPPVPVQPYKPVKLSGKEQERKSQLQKELLAHKRSALALKREGKIDEARAELKLAKSLEKKLEEIENAAVGLVKEVDKKAPMQSNQDGASLPTAIGDDYEEVEDVTDADMQDPELLDALKAFGWKTETQTTAIAEGKKPGKSSSETLDTLSRVDTPVSVEEFLELETATTLKELSHFDKSISVSKKYGNPPYTRNTDVSKPSDPMWQAIRKSSNKNLESQGVEKSAAPEDNPFEGEYGEIGIPVDIAPPLFNRPTPATHDLPKAHGLEAFDLLSGEAWNSPEKEVSVKDNSDDEEDVFDADLMGALQSLGLGPVPKVKPARISQGESAVVTDDVKPKELSATGHRDSSTSVFRRETHTDALRDTSLSKGNEIENVVTVQPPLSSSTDYVDIRTQASQNRVQRVGASTAVSAAADPATGSVQEQIKMHKRKAVSLKREGKMTEARDELRKAKMLEKQLEVETQVPVNGATEINRLPPATHSTIQDEPALPVYTSTRRTHERVEMLHSHEPVAKVHTVPSVMQAHREQAHQQVRQGKDRMKLQRESLAHKRKALGLRREGKMEEAEAESEIAKSLEKQMEDLDGGSSRPGQDNDMGMIEDLLDPQLMAALKGIGWNDGDLSAAGNVNRLESSMPSNNKSNQPVKPAGVTSTKTLPASASISSVHEGRQVSGSQQIHPPLAGLVTDAGSASANKVSGTKGSRADSEQRSVGISTGGAIRPSKKAQEERKQLEERIKQEKVRAVELKRSGRTGEALEVLRGAKRLEKQLESLTS